MGLKNIKKEKGFTLIEIIVVLVILGIVAGGLSGAIIFGAQHFIFAREANQLSQKAQLALARIKKELTDVKEISASSDRSIEYVFANGEKYEIKLDDNQITLRGVEPSIASQVLIDGLTENNGGETFLTYANDMAEIQVKIVMAFQGATNLSFQTTINPRKTAIPNVPSLN
jgi:prepilin-type N-terminal cleavage/methylation domain-containing protein